MKHFLLALALLAGQSWATFSLAVSVPAGGSTNIDVRPPTLIAPIPNQTTTPGQTVRIDLGHHLQCAPYFGSPVNDCVWSFLVPPTSGTYSIDANGVLTMNMVSNQTGLRARVSSSYGGGTIINSNTFTWTVSGGSSQALAGGARNFFVDNAGNNVNNGRFPVATGSNSCAAQGCVGNDGPWQTLSQVAAYPSFVAGDDVWLRGGGTWNEILSWSVAGGADPINNRLILGGYKLVGTQAFVNSPTNYTVSRLPSTYAYDVPRPIIRGSYQQSCRVTQYYEQVQIRSNGTYALGSAPMQKCAFHTAGYNDASMPGTDKGSYGVGGTPAMPANEFAAMISLKFASGKKWVTVQDIEIVASAGKGINLGMLPNEVVCINGLDSGGLGVDCKIETVLERIYSHHGARQANDPSGVARTVVRDWYVHDTNLSYADQQIGNNRAGPQAIPFGCSPCEFLVENFEARDTYSEIVAAYLTSHMLVRGAFGVNHSFSQGTQSDMIYESTVLYGSDHPLSPPTGHPTTIFPFWGMASDNGGGEQGGPQWYTFFNGTNGPANTQVLRRNNVMVGYETGPLFGYHVTKSTHPADNRPPFAWIYATGWDIGNTVVSGGQAGAVSWNFREMSPLCEEGSETLSDQPGVIASQYPGGCRPAPRSFLNSWKMQDNAFIVQSGYVALSSTWCVASKPALGTFTLGPNFFSMTDPPAACLGTGDVKTTTTGLPSYDWLGDGRSQTEVIEFNIENLRPAAGSPMIAGIPLLTNDGAIDQSGVWTWVLSQRKWLPGCNRDGMMSPAEWYQALARDYCENIRNPVTPALGALEPL